MVSFSSLALAVLPALASAGVVRRSNCVVTPPPPTIVASFNLAVHSADGTNSVIGYLNQSPDPYTVTTASDGSPIYTPYSSSSEPGSDFFQLASDGTWYRYNQVDFAHQSNTYDLIYFADAANAVGLPTLSCSIDSTTSQFTCTGGVFGLCGNDLSFWDGVNSNCPGPVTTVELYTV
ncbi:hypothetical protein SEUCBS139899_002973 [Sporothrix eucalyptigena]|uniref:Uncharacterized protein n=1 Tax=Sporothrix eucalyptigena TaxID=1812306 RepID=A0ABP0CA70_9PEZI